MKLNNRAFGFFIWLILVLLIFSGAVATYFRTSLQAGYSSHIVLVPAISAFLLWSERSRIFCDVKSGTRYALWIGAPGLVAVVTGLSGWLPRSYRFGDLVFVLGIVLLVMAGFIAAFGVTAFRKASFPFAMLAYLLPVPDPLVQKLIYFLQDQSANLSYHLFVAMGVPVLRNGFIMTLPGATIQVAKECSGINSSIALLIVATLFAHETLKTNWRRLLLVLLIIPLSIVKNAIRIVTLTLLAIRVDPSFLTGNLHHRGGIVFFLLTLVIAYPAWSLLRSTERRSLQNANARKMKLSENGSEYVAKVSF